MPIRLRLLGQPGIEGDLGGQGLPLGKPLALLIYLADHGAASRDHLAEVLWPSSDRSRARASVRQALWLLRQRLGEDVFESDEPVHMTAGVMTTDVDEVLKLLDGTPPSGEVQELIGVPLKGFLIPDAPVWRNWAEDFRSRISYRIGSRLMAHAEAHRSSGNQVEAEAFLRMALQLEPHRGEAHLLLISLLLDQGSIDHAEEAVTEARRLDDPDLRRDLEAADKRILRVRQDRFSRQRPDIETDYVGRSREMSGLMNLFRGAETGSGSMALLAGPAGIGKTRTVSEFCRMLPEEGVSVVSVRAHDSERSLKFGVVADLIRDLLSQPGAAGITAASDAILRGFFPSLQNGVGNGSTGPALAKPGEAATATVLADAFLDLVDAVSSEQALVMTVDDLHWADQDSRAVLSRAARAIGSTACLAIVTSREGADPNLTRALTTLRGQDRTHWFDLGPLSRPDLDEMLGLLATFETDSQLRSASEAIHRVSGGNPLFVLEVLRSLQRQGVLVSERDGRWRFVEPAEDLELTLPTTLRGTLLERLGDLDEGTLDVAAQIARGEARARGRAFLEDPDTAPRVKQLVAAGLVVASGEEGAVDFVHDEIRSAVRELRPPAHSRTVLTTGLIAAGLIALALGSWGMRGIGQDEAELPFGGGVVHSEVADQIHRFQFRGNPAVAVPLDTVPNRAQNRRRPQRIGNGSEVFTYVTTPPQGDPGMGWSPAPDSFETLLNLPGDEVPQGISPDGGALLYTYDDPDRPGYEMDLWLMDLRTRSRRKMVTAEEVVSAAWSPNGQHLAVLKIGAVDTLEIRTPDGALESRHTLERTDHFEWCGPEKVLLTAHRGAGATQTLLYLDGVTQRVGEDLEVVSSGTCSPDGRQVLAKVIQGGVVQVHLIDIATGLSQPTGVDPGLRLYWVPDTVSTIPTSVSLSSDTFLIEWGGSTIPGVTAVLNNGNVSDLSPHDRGRFPVRWVSRDPTVASIGPNGDVYGNGIGSTTVVAGVPGSARDSAVVVVAGAERTRALFLDSLKTDYSPRWIPFGHPHPILTEEAGDTVLFLNGDGSMSEGLATRGTFETPTGFTVEFEFQLPFRRRDRESLTACLSDTQPPTDERQRDEYGSWVYRSRYCFAYPYGYLSRFTPTEAAFGAAASVRYLDVSDALPSEGWVHVAIQGRPDGRLSLYLNRERIGEALTLAEELVTEPWRLVLTGHSVDTRLLVRNLVIWPMARYN